MLPYTDWAYAVVDLAWSLSTYMDDSMCSMWPNIGMPNTSRMRL